jgi:quinoprotein dehydrogenase-associated probable ABC transporter substrate-binding protein
MAMRFRVSDRVHRCRCAAVLFVCAVIGLFGEALGQTSEAIDRSSLRVCADPANLPFSNQAGEGFENKIAELLAAELGVPVRYAWYPQATGFVRQTLMARKCDLVIGISLGFELLQNTNPYYRSSYALVYRADSGLSATSLDDPGLKALRLGVVAGTPPSSLLAKYGLLGRVRPYQLVADTRFDQPAKQMIDDVAAGEVDVGVVWGPIAGYHAKNHNPKLLVVPLRTEPGEVRMDYRITMGVRFNEPNWKREINDLIKNKQPEINVILSEYGVPLLDNQGRQVTP